MKPKKHKEFLFGKKAIINPFRNTVEYRQYLEYCKSKETSKEQILNFIANGGKIKKYGSGKFDPYKYDKYGQERK